jgi:hydrogenase maturation protease
VVIRDGKIKNCQAVVPTTLNASPRDAKGNPGPCEASLLGNPVADPEKPLELLRTVHSFDPCMACACHTFDADGLGPYVIEQLLAADDFGPEVELLDAGTPALDLTLYFANADMLVVVDAVKSSVPAGTVLRYGREDLLRHHAPLRVDPHSPAWGITLQFGNFADQSPKEVFLVGASVGSTEPGT